MGDYVWRSYIDVEAEAGFFGAGLREIGCAVRQNVVMFAETRAEWMLAAHGCFKQSIPGQSTIQASRHPYHTNAVGCLSPYPTFSCMCTW